MAAKYVVPTYFWSGGHTAMLTSGFYSGMRFSVSALIHREAEKRNQFSSVFIFFST